MSVRREAERRADKEGERSGYGHHVSMHEPIQIEAMGKNSYQISGTPVDCVKLGLEGFLNIPIDLVIGGMNLGLSGTCW